MNEIIEELYNKIDNQENIIRELQTTANNCKQLKERIDKAIEYINNYDVFKEFTFPLMKRDKENQVKSSIDYQFKNDLKKDLLEILKGEDNE